MESPTCSPVLPNGTREFVTVWSHLLVDPVRQLETLADLFALGLLSRIEYERYASHVREPVRNMTRRVRHVGRQPAGRTSHGPEWLDKQKLPTGRCARHEEFTFSIPTVRDVGVLWRVDRSVRRSACSRPRQVQ